MSPYLFERLFRSGTARILSFPIDYKKRSVGYRPVGLVLVETK
jgi:hypothetical protein